MRVIAGAAKGRRLKAVPGLATRPTADRVRQTIFDILGDVEGDVVLDLFAGTGALGIEALSRGASRAVFVESASAAIKVLTGNLSVTGFDARADVRKVDAGGLIARPNSGSSQFDLVFLDPPYERGLAFVARIVHGLMAGDWLAPSGRVVAESPPGAIEAPKGLDEVRTRTFGRTQVTIWVRQAT